MPNALDNQTLFNAKKGKFCILFIPMPYYCICYFLLFFRYFFSGTLLSFLQLLEEVF